MRSLKALDIEAVGADEAPTVWTEFQTASPKPSEQTEPLAEETTAASADMPAEDKGMVVEIGDRVQVQMSGDTRVRVVKLTSDKHDPDLGIISAQHPSGAALLGAEEDEEIEFEIDGKPHRWMVVKIERERALVAA